MGGKVVPVTDELVAGTSAALGDGFQKDEIWNWLFPHRWQRRCLLSRYYATLIRRVFLPRQAAWTTRDAVGGALWFPPGTLDLRLSEKLLPGLHLVPGGIPGLWRGWRWERLVAENEPSEPHWRLNSLAVAPTLQGRGLGSALMEPGLSHADADGVGCYLETPSPANIPFYRRFGFEEIGEIRLPGSPPAWRMWRAPAEDNLRPGTERAAMLRA
jgi:GNAT superfamily N-acetyltransferase